MPKALSALVLPILIVYLSNLHTPTDGLMRFTNLKCITLDKSWGDFRSCRLKVPKRRQIAMGLHVELYQLPLPLNITINLALLKKANGYRPFLYNSTINFCQFMEHRKRYPFVDIFFSMWLKDSNINHTCPYNHDIIITDVVMKEDFLRLMPLPSGDYLFHLRVAAYDRWRVEAKLYLEVVEK